MLKHFEDDQFRKLSTPFGDLSRNQQEIGEPGIQLMIKRYVFGKFQRTFCESSMLKVILNIGEKVID